MHVITTGSEIEVARAAMTGSVGIVPTMGYLHEGHLSLVRAARKECDNVIVTIFVNPTQFGPNEDFERYPRDEARDLDMLRAEGVDAVFAPAVDEIYPPGFDDWVEVIGPLTERLEGEHRPGHFRGVTTVVARLFRIIRPDRAYFGQKDAQQLRVIRRMAQEQGLDVEIVPLPTIREPDGLAMSSRNVYLTPDQRAGALAISRSLKEAASMVREGIVDAAAVRDHVRKGLDGRVETPRRGVSAKDLDVDYVSVSDEDTLEELQTINRPALILVAARVGATRLIDNVVVVPRAEVPEHLRRLVEN